MKTPIRTSFEGDPRFPFQLVYCRQRSLTGELPDHLHDRCELVYTHQGQGTMFIDRAFYDQSPGDLFLIPADTIHRGLPSADAPVVSSALFFAPALAGADAAEDDGYAPLRCFEDAARSGRCKLRLPEEARAALESELSLMHVEAAQRLPGYRAAIRHHLGRVLLLVNRLLLEAGDPARVRIGPPWLEAALRDIDRSSELGATLAALADRANVSASHFARIFKHYTGMTVSEYVNAKRMAAAKKLLLGTDWSVAVISERCGFESLPHFHRTFKAYAHSSPGAWRRAARQ